MSSKSFTPPPPSIFAGENYHFWVVKMKTQHSDKDTKKYKTLSYLQNGVFDVIFTRIIACETLKQAWDKLKE
ncbi:pleiotropic drug resistance protein 3-like [Gossypium australe]|uniref:Pleiotropic drug resistance protein 3-like n=1 Tax=Gossypium australe TaxID=47621 RepID=A0A5B6VIS9_9ROSI|nr:pleiotropic drug resistance protein 3-like [Gossypium australe]